MPDEIDPEQPCMLRVPVKCVPTVVAALAAAGFAIEAEAVERFARDYTDPAADAARRRWLKLAEAVAADGEVEFDADATISHSADNGQYVLGWVWVDAPETDFVELWKLVAAADDGDTAAAAAVAARYDATAHEPDCPTRVVGAAECACVKSAMMRHVPDGPEFAERPDEHGSLEFEAR